jgi:hypothetical protein
MRRPLSLLPQHENEVHPRSARWPASLVATPNRPPFLVAWHRSLRSRAKNDVALEAYDGHSGAMRGFTEAEKPFPGIRSTSARLMPPPESWLNERVGVVTWAVCINRTYCGEGSIDCGSINEGYIGRV